MVQLTQEKFGEKIGVTLMTVCYWETGRSIPSAEMLQKIIREFFPRNVKVSIDDFLKRSKKENPKLSNAVKYLTPVYLAMDRASLMNVISLQGGLLPEGMIYSQKLAKINKRSWDREVDVSKQTPYPSDNRQNAQF